jgi:hypothetical protein
MDILERLAAEGRAAQADEALYQSETFWLAHKEIARLRAGPMGFRQQTALRKLIEAVTELAEVVQALNPGKDMSRIADALATARQQLTKAAAFE